MNQYSHKNNLKTQLYYKVSNKYVYIKILDKFGKIVKSISTSNIIFKDLRMRKCFISNYIIGKQICNISHLRKNYTHFKKKSYKHHGNVKKCFHIIKEKFDL